MNQDPFDLNQEQQASADAQLQRSQDAAAQAEDFMQVMGLKAGRSVVWGILQRAGVFTTSFSTDALVMAFKEGQRNEGLRILAQIHALCPDLYQVMVTENQA